MVGKGSQSNPDDGQPEGDGDRLGSKSYFAKVLERTIDYYSCNEQDRHHLKIFPELAGKSKVKS